MAHIPEKPAGSIIQQREESGGRVFFWQSLRSGPIYKSAVRDGVLFVCASIAGLVFIIYRLLVSPLGPSVPERLVFWGIHGHVLRGRHRCGVLHAQGAAGRERDAGA